MRASLVLRLRKLMTQTAHFPSVVWHARRQALGQGKAGAIPKNNDNRYLLSYLLHLPQFTQTMADAPAVKPWSIDDKKKLQQLIDDGKVDISRTEDINYIDSVRHEYYSERDNVNFCRNFRNYACSVDIKEHYQGYHALLAAGGIVYCRVRILFYYLSNERHPVRSLNHRGCR